MNMEFSGKFKFINIPEDAIICEWTCYNINLSFIPPVNSSIGLSESSIVSVEEITIGDVFLLDEETYIIFHDLVYYNTHDTIHNVVMEFKNGLNKWLNSHGCFSHNLKIDMPKKADCARMDKILLEKYDEANKQMDKILTEQEKEENLDNRANSMSSKFYPDVD